jgi:hypothetical protein
MSQQPVMHLLETGEGLEPLSKISCLARKENWLPAIFMSLQQVNLTEDQPDAFVCYLSAGQAGQTRKGADHAPRPILKLIKEAQTLEIPVALVTPHPAEKVGSHIINLDGLDIIITADESTSQEAIAFSMDDWLAQVATKSLVLV